MGRRLGARFIDGAIIGAIYFAIVIGGFVGSAKSINDCDPNAATEVYNACVQDAANGFAEKIVPIVAVLGLLSFVYEWLMIALKGATLGKLALGLRVVKVETGEKPGLGAAFIRWVIPVVGYFACMVGMLVVFLSPLWDKSGRQQGWHDKAAKVMVIRVK